MSSTFPVGFEDLEPYADWAAPTEEGRYDKRYNSSMAEVQEFYDLMIKRAGDALKYLNQRPLDDLRPEEQRLMDLCLALTEAAVAIEMFDRPDPPYLMPLSRLRPMHDSW